MFRGSAYSIQTDKDIINKSQLMEEEVRVAIIGVNDVGKSSMLGCIENEPFREDINSTKGVQLRFKKLRMNNYQINLYVWDGPGEKMEDFIHDGEFIPMDGILYVFDLTCKQSFHQLEQLHEMMKKQWSKIGKNACAVLVGNKADLLTKSRNIEADRQLNFLAERLAKREQMLYLKVSAKKNSSVKDAFVELIKQVLVTRCRGRTSRIFNEDHQIGHNKQNQPVGCSCCKAFNSCSNICAIF